MLKKLLSLLQNQQNTNLIIYGIGQGFNLITPLLVVPHIVAICGVENFGKTSIAMAISFFLMVFIDYGSDIVGVKEVAVNRENNEQLASIFITTFTTKFILLIGILLIVSVLFLFVPYFNQEKTMFFLGLPVLIGQFINPTWFLQGVENFKWITISTIFSKIIYLFGIFFFIHQTADYVYINLFWGIGMILANGFAFVYLLKKYAISFKKLKFETVLSLLKLNFSMFFSQIFVSLQMYAPVMLLGFFGNNFLAGSYRIIDQIITIFKTYIYLFFNFLYSRVCFLLHKNKNEGIRFWKIYNGLNFVFITISMLIIYIFAIEVVSFFTKNHIIEISNLLKIAVLIPLIISISNPLKQLVLGFNENKFYVSVTMILVMVNLLIMILLIPILKINGVLFSLIFIEILTVICYVFRIKNKIKPD